MRRVLDDREVERGRRRRTGEIENQNLIFCIIGFYVLSGFFFKINFFLNNADMENCGSFKSFNYIYIIYLLLGFLVLFMNGGIHIPQVCLFLQKILVAVFLMT